MRPKEMLAAGHSIKPISSYLNNHYLYNLHCFYEGYDDLYYADKIRNRVISEYGRYQCGSRENVLKAFEMLESTGRDDAAVRIYFVDHDYHHHGRESESIYTTPCYSIENFYATPAAVRRAFKQHTNFDEQLIQDIAECYAAELEQFCNQISEVNAWAKIVREIEKEENRRRFDLKQLNLKRQIDFVEGEVVCECSSACELLKGEVGTRECDDLLDEYKNAMTAPGGVNCGRGKFLTIFISWFLAKLEAQRQKREGVFLDCEVDEKISEINEKNIVDRWASCAECPECLQFFLLTTKSKLDEIG